MRGHSDVTWKEGRLDDSSPRQRQNRQDTSFLGYNIHRCAVLLRSSLSWSRFVADERPLTLNVPMVKSESDRGPFGAITSDGKSTEMYDVENST